MEFLKKILSEETFNKVETLIGEELSTQIDAKLGDFAVDIAKEKFIPKQTFDSINEEKKALKAELLQRDAQLTELSGKVKGNAELELQIKNLQEENTKKIADYETKLKDTTQTYALKEALSKHSPKNLKALEALLDKAKVSYEYDENGALKDIKGLNEQVEELKKSDGYLFGQTTGTGSPQTANNFQSLNEDGVTAEFRKLNPNIKL